VVTAANSTYIVTFDGATLTVTTRRNPGRILWRVPVENLMAVEFKPAGRLSAGRLYLHGLGRPTPYDMITFRQSEQGPFEAVALTILERLGKPAGPDADGAAPGSQLTVRDVAFMRTMSGTRTSVVPVIIAFAVVLMIAVVAVWAFTS
jgi:hypothetical protein